MAAPPTTAKEAITGVISRLSYLSDDNAVKLGLQTLRTEALGERGREALGAFLRASPDWGLVQAVWDHQAENRAGGANQTHLLLAVSACIRRCTAEAAESRRAGGERDGEAAPAPTDFGAAAASLARSVPQRRLRTLYAALASGSRDRAAAALDLLRAVCEAGDPAAVSELLRRLDYSHSGMRAAARGRRHEGNDGKGAKRKSDGGKADDGPAAHPGADAWWLADPKDPEYDPAKLPPRALFASFVAAALRAGEGGGLATLLAARAGGASALAAGLPGDPPAHALVSLKALARALQPARRTPPSAVRPLWSPGALAALAELADAGERVAAGSADGPDGGAATAAPSAVAACGERAAALLGRVAVDPRLGLAAREDARADGGAGGGPKVTGLDAANLLGDSAASAGARRLDEGRRALLRLLRALRPGAASWSDDLVLGACARDRELAQELLGDWPWDLEPLPSVGFLCGAARATKLLEAASSRATADLSSEACSADDAAAAPAGSALPPPPELLRALARVVPPRLVSRAALSRGLQHANGHVRLSTLRLLRALLRAAGRAASAAPPGLHPAARRHLSASFPDPQVIQSAWATVEKSLTAGADAEDGDAPSGVPAAAAPRPTILALALLRALAAFEGSLPEALAAARVDAARVAGRAVALLGPAGAEAAAEVFEAACGDALAADGAATLALGDAARGEDGVLCGRPTPEAPPPAPLPAALPEALRLAASAPPGGARDKALRYALRAVLRGHLAGADPEDAAVWLAALPPGAHRAATLLAGAFAKVPRRAAPLLSACGRAGALNLQISQDVEAVCAGRDPSARDEALALANASIAALARLRPGAARDLLSALAAARAAKGASEPGPVEGAIAASLTWAEATPAAATGSPTQVDGVVSAPSSAWLRLAFGPPTPEAAAAACGDLRRRLARDAAEGRVHALALAALAAGGAAGAARGARADDVAPWAGLLDATLELCAPDPPLALAAVGRAAAWGPSLAQALAAPAAGPAAAAAALAVCAAVGAAVERLPGWPALSPAAEAAAAPLAKAILAAAEAAAPAVAALAPAVAPASFARHASRLRSPDALGAALAAAVAASPAHSLAIVHETGLLTRACVELLVDGPAGRGRPRATATAGLWALLDDPQPGVAAPLRAALGGEAPRALLARALEAGGAAAGGSALRWVLSEAPPAALLAALRARLASTSAPLAAGALEAARVLALCEDPAVPDAGSPAPASGHLLGEDLLRLSREAAGVLSVPESAETFDESAAGAAAGLLRAALLDAPSPRAGAAAARRKRREVAHQVLWESLPSLDGRAPSASGSLLVGLLAAAAGDSASLAVGLRGLAGAATTTSAIDPGARAAAAASLDGPLGDAVAALGAAERAAPAFASLAQAAGSLAEGVLSVPSLAAGGLRLLRRLLAALVPAEWDGVDVTGEWARRAGGAGGPSAEAARAAGELASLVVTRLTRHPAFLDVVRDASASPLALPARADASQRPPPSSVALAAWIADDPLAVDPSADRPGAAGRAEHPARRKRELAETLEVALDLEQAFAAGTPGCVAGLAAPAARALLRVLLAGYGASLSAVDLATWSAARALSARVARAEVAGAAGRGASGASSPEAAALEALLGGPIAEAGFSWGAPVARAAAGPATAPSLAPDSALPSVLRVDPVRCALTVARFPEWRRVSGGDAPGAAVAGGGEADGGGPAGALPPWLPWALRALAPAPAAFALGPAPARAAGRRRVARAPQAYAPEGADPAAVLPAALHAARAGQADAGALVRAGVPPLALRALASPCPGLRAVSAGLLSRIEGELRGQRGMRWWEMPEEDVDAVEDSGEGGGGKDARTRTRGRDDGRRERGGRGRGGVAGPTPPRAPPALRERIPLGLTLQSARLAMPSAGSRLPSLSAAFAAEVASLSPHPTHELFPHVYRGAALDAAVLPADRLPLLRRHATSGKPGAEAPRRWALRLVAAGARGRRDAEVLRRRRALALARAAGAASQQAAGDAARAVCAVASVAGRAELADTGLVSCLAGMVESALAGGARGGVPSPRGVAAEPSRDDPALRAGLALRSCAATLDRPVSSARAAATAAAARLDLALAAARLAAAAERRVRANAAGDASDRHDPAAVAALSAARVLSLATLEADASGPGGRRAKRRREAGHVRTSPDAPTVAAARAARLALEIADSPAVGLGLGGYARAQSSAVPQLEPCSYEVSRLGVGEQV